MPSVQKEKEEQQCAYWLANTSSPLSNIEHLIFSYSFTIMSTLARVASSSATSYACRSRRASSLALAGPNDYSHARLATTRPTFLHIIIRGHFRRRRFDCFRMPGILLLGFSLLPTGGHCANFRSAACHIIFIFTAFIFSTRTLQTTFSLLPVLPSSAFNI